MDRITALVTGADHPTGLGSARALQAAGGDVVGLTHRPDRTACRSRAWKEIVPIQGPTADDALETVIATAHRIGGPVFLLPSGDRFVRVISTGRHLLPDNVRTVLPSDPTVELLLEKTRFVPWAQENGFPVPRSAVVSSPSELEEMVHGFRLPALLKPLVRTGGWQRVSPVEKVIRLSDPADLRRIPFDLFEAAPSYVLSEWIEGGDDDVRFCLVYLNDASEVVASFTGRKLLQYPRLTGSTAICVDHPDAELEALTARLFKETGCQGLASLEVKRSTVDGQYLITEPTVGRPNLQSAAAVLGGVNLHGIAMRDAWGRAYDDLLGPRRRCFWVEEQGLFELLTTSSGIPIPLGMIFRKALSARRLGGAYFGFADPAPFVSMAGDWLRRAVRQLTGRNARRLPDGPAD